jgi:hypothetical protein
MILYLEADLELCQLLQLGFKLDSENENMFTGVSHTILYHIRPFLLGFTFSNKVMTDAVLAASQWVAILDVWRLGRGRRVDLAVYSGQLAIKGLFLHA